MKGSLPVAGVPRFLDFTLFMIEVLRPRQGRARDSYSLNLTPGPPLLPVSLAIAADDLASQGRQCVVATRRSRSA
jgi:hypothetical protein